MHFYIVKDTIGASMAFLHEYIGHAYLRTRSPVLVRSRNGVLLCIPLFNGDFWCVRALLELHRIENNTSSRLKRYK